MKRNNHENAVTVFVWGLNKISQSLLIWKRQFFKQIFMKFSFFKKKKKRRRRRRKRKSLQNISKKNILTKNYPFK